MSRFVISQMCLAALLCSDLWLGAAPTFAAAPAVVALGVVAAAVIGGALTPFAAVSGAIGAALFATVAPQVSVAGAALLALGLWAPRAARARGGWAGLALHGAVAAASFAAATWIVEMHSPSDPAVRAVAVVVAVVLSAAPWLLPADERLASSLEAWSRRMAGSARWRLERAAALRRAVVGRRRSLPRAERRRLDAVFEEIASLAAARAAAPEATASTLDEALADHLAALEEAVRVIGARDVAVAGARRDAAASLREESLGIAAEAEAFAATASPVSQSKP